MFYWATLESIMCFEKQMHEDHGSEGLQAITDFIWEGSPLKRQDKSWQTQSQIQIQDFIVIVIENGIVLRASNTAWFWNKVQKYTKVQYPRNKPPINNHCVHISTVKTRILNSNSLGITLYKDNRVRYVEFLLISSDIKNKSGQISDITKQLTPQVMLQWTWYSGQ